MLRSVFGAAIMATTGALPVFMLTAQSALVVDDLGITESALGLLVTCFYSLAALTSIPTGRLIENGGDPASAVRLATGLSATATAIIAFGPSSVWVVGLGLLVGAVGTSCAQAAANLMLSVTAPPRHQGLGFGVKQSALPAASMLAGLVVPTIGISLGWRWGFGLAAAVAALACVLIPIVALTPTTDRTPVKGADRLVPAKRRGPVYLFALGSVTGTIAMGSVMTYFVLWSVRSGIPVGTAGAVLAAASLGSIVLRVVGGIVADRKGGRVMGVVIAAITVGVVGIACIATGSAPLIYLGAFLTLTLSWSWPGLMLFSIARTSDAPVSTISILQTGAYAGNAVGPGLFGLIIAASSYRVGWIVAAACMAVTAVLMIWGRSLRGHEIRQARAAAASA